MKSMVEALAEAVDAVKRQGYEKQLKLVEITVPTSVYEQLKLEFLMRFSVTDTVPLLNDDHAMFMGVPLKADADIRRPRYTFEAGDL